MFSHNLYKNGSSFDTLCVSRNTSFGSSLYIGRYVLAGRGISWIFDQPRLRSDREWIGKRLQSDFWTKLIRYVFTWSAFCQNSTLFKDWVILPEKRSEFTQEILKKFVYGKLPYSLTCKQSRNKIKRFVKDLYEYQLT